MVGPVRVAILRAVLHILSGPEMLILPFAERLRETEFAPVIVNLWDGQPPCLPLHEAALSRGLDSEVVSGHGGFNPLIIVRLAERLRELRVDLVHTHGFKPEVAAILASRLRPVPIVASYYGMVEMHSWRVRVYQSITPLIVRFFDLVLANSASLARELAGFLIPARKLRVVPSAVDTTQFAPLTNAEVLEAKKALNVGSDERIIAIVGRLDPEKGHTFLFRALARISKSLPPWRCLVVGNGRSGPALEAQATALGIRDQLTFTGYRADLRQVMGAADLLVSASLREGMPVNILNGMAITLPVVATTVGGVPEVVRHGHTGLLVPPGNEVALGEAIAQLMNDPTKAREMGEEGRRVVETCFSADAMTARILACYREVLNK